MGAAWAARTRGGAMVGPALSVKSGSRMDDSFLTRPARVRERQRGRQVRPAAEEDENEEDEDEGQHEDEVRRDVDVRDLRPVGDRERDAEEARADEGPERPAAGEHG